MVKAKGLHYKSSEPITSRACVARLSGAAVARAISFAAAPAIVPPLFPAGYNGSSPANVHRWSATPNPASQPRPSFRAPRGGQSWRQRIESLAQGHLQAIGQEADENVPLHSRLHRMVNRTQPQVVFETLEHRFDLDQQGVKFPQPLRLLVTEVAAQKVMTVVKFGFVELLLLESERETARRELFTFLVLLVGWRGLGHLAFHQRRRPSGLGLGSAQAQQQPVARSLAAQAAQRP